MNAAPQSRRAYIDWLRGIAVLAMIWAHTFDAWTRLADRQTAFFRWALVLGGCAAPLFLFLAGLGTALSASSKFKRSGSRRTAVEGVVKRGLEIFLLAYLFRLQAFIVTPGSPPITVFRIDILNVMGPSMALAGLVWGLTRDNRVRAVALALLAGSIALATPVFRLLPAIDRLPTLLQWYLRPAGEHTTFTLFPWMGFVMGGAAAGVLLDAARSPSDERRSQVVLPAMGALLVAVGFYTAAQPTIYQQSYFWTSSPTFFSIRTGGMLMALGACYWVARATGISTGADPLAVLGRGSLFVYWIHVELVYGYTTWPLRRHLTPAQVLFAWAVFSLLMYLVLAFKNRTVDRWKARGPRAGTSPSLAPVQG